MALDLTDIYQCQELIDEMKKKYTDISDEPLQMGIYGYLGEVHSNILQNSAQTAAENALEGLPTKAKYPRNVLNHAYSLGISTTATPANMNVILFLPEERIDSNLDGTGRFYIDHLEAINIEGFEYHLDYDIVIRKVQLPNKEVIYTAQYDMNEPNFMSTITNPYIKSIGRYMLSGTRVLAIQTSIKQVRIEKEEIPLYSSNPLQLKTFNFTFIDQLVGFTVKVEEDDNVHYLEPIYDGQVNKTATEFINYTFITENNIRCIFRKSSYQPRVNSIVTLTKYTTLGTKGNFQYKGSVQSTLKSNKTSSVNIWMIIKPLTDSVGGEDSKSITELKNIIPIERLARGSITNTSDLYNFFNSINTEDRKIYFVKKLDSFERLYYSYVALKDSNNNIIPTNTIDLQLSRKEFDAIDTNHYQLLPGNCIYYRSDSSGKVITSYLSDDEAMTKYRNSGFLYTNIFDIVVNKNPFYISYLLTTFNDNFTLNFDYINQNSILQVVCESVNWKRSFFNNKNTYTLTIRTLHNLFSDLSNYLSVNYMTTDWKSLLKVIVVFKNRNDGTVRYTIADISEVDTVQGQYEFIANITTDNVMNNSMQLKLTGLYEKLSTYKSDAYFSDVFDLDFYICIKLSTDYGGRSELDTIVPNLKGWTCCNKYSVTGGLPLYYNYTKEINTFVNLEQGSDNDLYFYINKVPMIKYDYVITEDRLLDVISSLQLIRSYIEYKLEAIEDGFGLDMKLFNTYGPAKFFQTNTGKQLDNVSLKLVFKTKPYIGAADTYLDDLIQYIKDYIESFDTMSAALHIPNLQADVTKAFAETIEYFEFLGFNDYGQTVQHLYRSEFETKISEVPELLSIDINDDDSPRITIQVSST